MQYTTLDALMRAANCEKYPERWEVYFEETMRDFDENGCPLTDPAYYDRLRAEYGVLVTYPEVYREAALAVGRNEALSRLLHLLVRVLADRETVFEDLKQFRAPASPNGTHDIAYDMLTGLAICSLVPYSYGVLKRRGLPESVILDTIRTPEKGIPEYRKRNGGADGFHLLEWFQRSVEGRIFRIKRLEIEMTTFKSRAAVFQNKQGDTVALVDGLMLHRDGFALGSKHFEDEAGAFLGELTETDRDFCGYPYLENGYVSPTRITLNKSEWTRVLSVGDPVISLHIPADGSLAPEKVDETLEETRAFFKQYYPDFKYKAFYCGSWLLDPQLEEMLGAQSNIARFGRRFSRLTAKSGGNAVFGFVFLKPNPAEVILDDLPENTRLERALKAHYKSGKAIYELQGYFFG
jgi:hypothetical protein